MSRSLWRMESVPGDVRLAFGRVGEGPQPVVALHGITAQHRAFNSTARHLEYPDGMVAVDLRGRGNSDKPPSGNYGLGVHASDVVRVLDHLGVDRGVLIGHSMGAFVALHTALLYPDRVRALLLIDGGWPRPEKVDEAEQTAIQEGLARAFKRLDMVFESSEQYLNFWFPGQNLTLSILPPDLADYYSYDLESLNGGYSPKAAYTAADEDANSVSSESPTAEELTDISCPVALVRAGEGFFPGTQPLVSDEAKTALANALDLRYELLVPGATHYTIMFDPFAARWANVLRPDSPLFD